MKALKSWGQWLDSKMGWMEVPVVLPPLDPPAYDAIAVAYPKTSPGYYWWTLGTALVLACFGVLL